MGYRTTSDYAVVCDLGVQHFDSPRAGVAMARAAYGEMRRLGVADERVRSTRWRRSARLTVELTITVRATDARQAFEVAGGLLRTGIHVVGGTTAGWELVRPELHVASRRGRRRRARATEPAPLLPPPDWSQWSDAARHRMERAPALPPLGAACGAPMPRVIDLR